MTLKYIVKMLLPPILWEILRSVKKRRKFYGFYGDFNNWDEVKAIIEKNGYGYDSTLILDRVSKAITKIRIGEASFERDSMIFFEDDYNYPFLTALLYIYSQDNRLNTIDFGGSLGSSYFQNRKIFSGLNVKWTVVEQKKFVDYGKKEIPEVEFSYTVEDCINESINCLVLSSSLQYLDDPYNYLEGFLSYNIPYIVVDRAPLIDKDRLVLQRVSPEIYEATYPAWLLSEENFIEYMDKNNYEIVCRWNSADYLALKTENKINSINFQGFLFRLRT